MKLLLFLGLACTTVFAQNCGESNFSPVPPSTYIVGGQNANEGDFPWQVGLVENGYLICGGTYVESGDSRLNVITAAHCLSRNPRPADYSVVFGMHRTNVVGNRVIIGSDTIQVHERYSSSGYSYDIAIIGVVNQQSITDIKSTWAKPACLPSGPHRHGEPAVVSGWGTTSEGGSSSSTLQYVWKELLSNVECEKTGNAGQIDETMLCAGEAGKDACQGDSGGPLVAYRIGKWELVGVVSWGYGCGRDGYPGVYADPWNLLDWVLGNL